MSAQPVLDQRRRSWTPQRPHAATTPLVVASADPGVREGLRRAVRGSLFTVVVEAAGALDTVEAVAEQPPAACIVDLTLPGGGLSVLSAITVLAPEVALVAVAAAPGRADVAAALAAGAAACLPQRSGLAIVRAVAAALDGYATVPLDSVRTPLAPAEGPPSHALSARERQVLRLAAVGLGNDEIARRLVLSPSTVRNHLTRIMRKLGARNRGHAALIAARSGQI